MGPQRVIESDAVALIATLLRGEDDRWPIFLLGAGASFRSGVRTAAEAAKQIAKIVYAERKLQGARPAVAGSLLSTESKITEAEPYVAIEEHFNFADPFWSARH